MTQVDTGNLSPLWQELSKVSTAIQVLNTKVEADSKRLADREWVKETIEPIQEAIVSIKSSVAMQAVSVESMSAKMSGLFDAHNAFIKKQAEEKDEESKSRTPLGLIKKYAPVTGFIGGCFTIYRVVGTALELWINSHK